MVQTKQGAAASRDSSAKPVFPVYASQAGNFPRRNAVDVPISIKPPVSHGGTCSLGQDTADGGRPPAAHPPHGRASSTDRKYAHMGLFGRALGAGPKGFLSPRRAKAKGDD